MFRDKDEPGRPPAGSRATEEGRVPWKRPVSSPLGPGCTEVPSPPVPGLGHTRRGGRECESDAGRGRARGSCRLWVGCRGPLSLAGGAGRRFGAQSPARPRGPTCLRGLSPQVGAASGPPAGTALLFFLSSTAWGADSAGITGTGLFLSSPPCVRAQRGLEGQSH